MAARRTPLKHSWVSQVERVWQSPTPPQRAHGDNIPFLIQAAFRYRDDDGSETLATWRQNANVDDSLDVDTNYRMRFLLQNTDADDSAIVKAQLQYNHEGAGWNNVTGASSVVRASASNHVAEDQTTSEQMAGPQTFVGGGIDEVDGIAQQIGSDIAIGAEKDTEVEYCFQIRSADVENNDSIQLRIIDNATALDQYDNTPTITVVAGGGAVEVGLTGSQPAMSGTIAKLQDLLRSVAGSQPASTGAITALQSLLRSLAGSQPASTATISVKYLINLAGSQPASTGAISTVVITTEEVAGSQPASTGALSAVQSLLRSLTGNQPASTGALTALQLLQKSLAGSQPASTAALSVKYLISLVGAQPASTGTVDAVIQSATIELSGSQPASTGALAVKYLISLAGAQPSSTGVLTALQSLLVSLSGNQPAQTGTLSALQSLFRSLTGSQPASTAALAVKYLISLVGSQPASTGAIDSVFITAESLAGSQPASTGAISVKYLISLSGLLANQSGALTLLYLISLAGSQPASTGTVSALAAAATYDLEGFRFRADDADEDEAAWLDDQDVSINILTMVPFRLRTLVDSSVADPDAGALTLQYRKVGDPDWVTIQ